MSVFNGAPASLLLSLPRELRDEIYSHLVLPPHVFTSSPRPDSHSLHRTRKFEKVYIDSRIYFPLHSPFNVLSTCKQLREECLDFVARSTNQQRPGVTGSDEAGEPKSWKLAARANNDLEEINERKRDDGSVRVTLEIERYIRGSMGGYNPERTEPSPQFLVLLPHLKPLKRIKFIVWGGWDWWRGPQQRFVRMNPNGKARFKRTTSDETDTRRDPTKSTAVYAPPDPEKPDRLTVAIDALLKHLPLVEEVTVDVLMHASDYWNWDLQEDRRQGIQGWLNRPISLDERKLKSVCRNLIACEPCAPNRSATFFSRIETWSDGIAGPYVSEKFGKVPEDWDDGM